MLRIAGPVRVRDHAMLRLERRALRDPNEAEPPVRLQDCVDDDARRLLIQWTEEGTWYLAGEQGFQYTVPGLAFTFIANVGGASAEEGRVADGRVFVLLNGLDAYLTARHGALTVAEVRRIAMDIEETMMLWPGLVPSGLARRVYFWFPDRHPTRYAHWLALRDLFGIGPTAQPQGDDVGVEWLQRRAWKGSIV